MTGVAQSREPRLPGLLTVLLVALPLVAVTFAAMLFGTRWLLAGRGLGSDDLSLLIAYGLIAMFSIATLAQVIAVPWAAVLLVREPALRTGRGIGAVAVGLGFALVTVAIAVLTAAYAGGA